MCWSKAVLTLCQAAPLPRGSWGGGQVWLVWLGWGCLTDTLSWKAGFLCCLCFQLTLTHGKTFLMLSLSFLDSEAKKLE